MPKEGKEKEEKKSWPDNFKGKVVYDKDGVRVFKSEEIPFRVALLPDGSKKIVPEKVDIKTIDFTTLPDVDTKDLDKNVTTAKLYGLPKIDEKAMTDWNKMTDWLGEKGYAGNPQMNNVEFSKKAFNEFKKENPDNSITYDHVLPMQMLMHQYRNEGIDKINSGKMKVQGEVLPDRSNFMSHAATELGSKDDGILGQETSTFKLPSTYLNQIKPENRIGFVPTGEQANSNSDAPAKQPAMATGRGIFYNKRRVGELFPVDKDNSIIKFRNDFGATGQQIQLPNSDLQKYLGTTDAVQSSDLYKELTSKATSTVKK